MSNKTKQTNKQTNRQITSLGESVIKNRKKSQGCHFLIKSKTSKNININVFLLSYSVDIKAMDGKDRHSKSNINTGLLNFNSARFYENNSSGLRSHPNKIVVPLPLSEDININKIENVPEKVSLPVNPESKILEKSVPDEKQKKIYKRRKIISSNPENLSADISLGSKQKKQQQTYFTPRGNSISQTKRKKISASNFSFY